MNKVYLKIRPWENAYIIQYAQPVKKGDILIVETPDGTESAIVEFIKTAEKERELPNLPNEASSVKVIRKANLRDLDIIEKHRHKEREYLKICREQVKKIGLPMKIIGTSCSFDGGNVSFTFIADGRVDFRELVKILSKNFQRSVRLYQIGARDEARISGGYGICGRELCCIRFIENLPSISSEMAKAQHIVRRGSERISGLCGRLMCCLAYEADQYQKMLEKMPAIESEIITKEGKGVIKKVNPLAETALVELSDGKIIDVSLKDIL